MGEHHAGIAPGAKNGGLGSLMGHRMEPPVLVLPEMVGDGLDGEGQVGAGIPVRNRKYIDPVQLPSLLLDIIAGSEEGAAEPWASR